MNANGPTPVQPDPEGVPDGPGETGETPAPPPAAALPLRRLRALSSLSIDRHRPDPRAVAGALGLEPPGC